LDKLEYQANNFASCLLLPRSRFIESVAEFKTLYKIHDRGHGFIFVDNQLHNYIPYNSFIQDLKDRFQASKAAIEIRLKKLNLLIDHRE
jgi:Zn-dependent peptidase ImmA (M78 family)